MQNTLRSKVKEAVNKFRDDHHLRHNKDHGSPNPPESPSNNDRPSRPQKATSYVQQQTDLPSSLRSSSPNKRGPGPSRDEQKDLHPVTERDDEHAQPGPTGELSHNPSRANPANAFAGLKDRHNATPEEVRKTTLAQCETPMVLEIGDENVAINTQIQLYATNAQLCHPWVSPILGYMGGLPPLLIIAGNEEVLRDEIIFA
jgi:acetyl esterase/lipase